MSRRAKVNEFWSANVELEIKNIAFQVDYDERKEGARTIRTFKPRFIKNGKVMFDVGSKIRGWLKEQVRTIKPSAYESVQYGFKAFSLPKAGEIPIADAKELSGDLNFPEKFKAQYELPVITSSDETTKLPYPFMETIIVKEGKRARSTFSFHYLLPNKVKVKARLFCFARNITPEVVEDLMQKLGDYTGLGDKHSQGYGNFKLLRFKAETGQLKL